MDRIPRSAMSNVKQHSVIQDDQRPDWVAPEITRLAIKRTPASVDCGETPD
jgi:hypothetical protein